MALSKLLAHEDISAAHSYLRAGHKIMTECWGYAQQ